MALLTFYKVVEEKLLVFLIVMSAVGFSFN